MVGPVAVGSGEDEDLAGRVEGGEIKQHSNAFTGGYRVPPVSPVSPKIAGIEELADVGSTGVLVGEGEFLGDHEGEGERFLGGTHLIDIDHPHEFLEPGGVVGAGDRDASAVELDPAREREGDRDLRRSRVAWDDRHFARGGFEAQIADQGILWPIDREAAYPHRQATTVAPRAAPVIRVKEVHSAIMSALSKLVTSAPVTDLVIVEPSVRKNWEEPAVGARESL